MSEDVFAKRLISGEKNEFSQVSIKIASPDTIRVWSNGEIKNPETINYRTFKPEWGGLFCERTFGPTKDWECSCGKYKRIKHKGIICDRCGVEVTQSKVRRERMGHIELAVPVAHIWFFKTMPGRIGNVLGISSRLLERVLYYEDYIVIDPGTTPLEKKQLLSETEYRDALSKYGRDFKAKMGAEAVQELLAQEDLNILSQQLKVDQNKTRSVQAKKKISKRLKIVEGLITSENKPEWMILKVIPVIPPDLRPLVPLEGGRFATSDLNDLYRRVINRNNRLKTILDLKTPDVIVRNEKRMLQEAVDALFDNGRHGRPVLGTGNRPLKSLSDMLKGKQGRFRQNLLGKRVDYSGRAVIVVGPELRLNQCGLPKKMALELYEPFIIRKLKDRGMVHTIKSAKKLIETGSKEVWDILEEVTKGHPVLLNRAPTLHRMGIQAFEPILIEGEAIRVHPLVCAAFNADFDGDQMAVHVPLSVESLLEAKTLVLSANNIFSPASGKPIISPTQDIILGCYYLTKDYRKQAYDSLPRMSNAAEVLMAYDHGQLDIHSPILLQLEGRMVKTTIGRVMFNEIMPEGMDYINEEITKKNLNRIILKIYKEAGHLPTIKVLDDLKEMGFREATKAGISISLSDMLIPDSKQEMIAVAHKEVDKVEKQYTDGSITEGERYNKIVDIWTHTTDKVGETLFKNIETNYGKEELNPLFIMVDSGARGSQQQIRQLAGMRGLMAKPSGEIIENPIISNFKEGLSVREYFISTHGARKGLADTALKTADSGYLTRRLVDVTQDVIIRVLDCGTLNGINAMAIFEGDEEVISLKEKIYGRVAAEDIFDSRTGEILVNSDEMISEEQADFIDNQGVVSVKIRSALTCESKFGICSQCYGMDLSTGKKVAIGASVGIIASQSIGEPGTQLTMRTFHIGGTASSVFKQPKIVAKKSGRLHFQDIKTVETLSGKTVVLNKTGFVLLVDEEGNEVDKFSLTVGSVVEGKEGDAINEGDTFITWDPYNVPILSEQAGYVQYHDLVEGQTVSKELDATTGLYNLIVIEHKADLHPQVIVTHDKAGKDILGYYSIPAGAHITVTNGQKIDAGSQLAKTPRKISKTKDITGGLPRVAELFEARQPKEAAEIAKIDGIVEFRGTVKGKRVLVIRDEITGIEEEHLIPHKKHLTVFHNYRVKKGQQLTEGPIIPHEILDVCGPLELQEYLVNQVQEVYRLQGVEINDKHIEIIIRQMLKKVRITNPGDTSFLYNAQIDKNTFKEENDRVAKKSGKTAEAAPLLLGITKASLGIDSFISAASFQETTRVLTDAATEGKMDHLRGFKENIIMGHVITAGTGISAYRNLKLKGPELLQDVESDDDSVDNAEEVVESSV